MAQLVDDAVRRGLSRGATGVRASDMVHRGLFCSQGEHTLRSHLYADAEDAVWGRAALEAHAAAVDATPVSGLRCLPTPFRHSGDAPGLDAELAAHASRQWADVARASPTLAAGYAAAVPLGA